MTNIKDTLLNFQFQYSRLFNFGLNRKKFEVISTSDKLFAMNTSKNTFIALLFTLFSCGLLFSGFIEGFINKQEITMAFIIVFGIHFIVGLVGLRQFLWLINGRQELVIENGNLTLTKRGTFFTKPKTYSLDFVANVRQAIDESNLSLIDKIQFNIGLNRKVIFGHIIGQVLFDYKNNTIKLFNDLDKNERIELIKKIKTWTTSNAIR